MTDKTQRDQTPQSRKALQRPRSLQAMISAIDAWMALALGTAPPALDVRSEGEFEQGHFPGFLSAPILNNDERRQVGITYKSQGPDLAQRLGYELVRDHIEERTQRWIDHFDGKPGWVACWRGGLRSQIAASWVIDRKISCVRIEGGYKALRHLALETLKVPPPLIVIAGMTGCGKTEILQSSPRSINLEALAQHRGSSFGGHLLSQQPSQSTFENALALRYQELRGLADQPRTAVIEDESLFIGNLFIGHPLKNQMIASPVICVVAALEDRVLNIYREYIEKPLNWGVHQDLLFLHLEKSLLWIQRALGSDLTSTLVKQLKQAFERDDPKSLAAHLPWIEPLLVRYYDPRYAYSMSKNKRPILFKGDAQSCRQRVQEIQ